VEPALADGPIVNAAEVDGSVALVKRGGNLFQDKAKLVQAAGAIGMVVINNSDALFAPLGSEGHQSVRIPVVAIAQESAQMIAAGANRGWTVYKVCCHTRAQTEFPLLPWCHSTHPPTLRSGADLDARATFVWRSSPPPEPRPALSHAAAVASKQRNPAGLFERDMASGIDICYQVVPPQSDRQPDFGRQGNGVRLEMRRVDSAEALGNTYASLEEKRLEAEEKRLRHMVGELQIRCAPSRAWPHLRPGSQLCKPAAQPRGDRAGTRQRFR
jgi:hypothetical protein